MAMQKNIASYQQIIGDLNNPVCPKPTSEFLPSCWRAGQIIEDRCLQEGLSKDECVKRAEKTREFTANLGLGGHTFLITGETPDDWLEPLVNAKTVFFLHLIIIHLPLYNMV